MWNFLLVDDASDKREATELFFVEISSGKYEIYISEAVRAEVVVAPEVKRRALFDVIKRYDPITLEQDEEVQSLAEMYVENGVLSRNHFTDLLHLAYASVNGMYALISWNMNHLVKMKTHALGNSVNRANGYPDILIFTPQQATEVIDNE